MSEIILIFVYGFSSVRREKKAFYPVVCQTRLTQNVSQSRTVTFPRPVQTDYGLLF